MSPHPPEATIVHKISRVLWWSVLLIMAAAIIGVSATGLRLGFTGYTVGPMAVAVYAAVTYFYSHIRVDERLSQALVAGAQLTLLLLFAVLCSYVAAAMALPYRDHELLAVDRWLGFDRAGYVAFFTNRPWKANLTYFTYMAIGPQLAAVPFALMITNRMQRFQQFVAAFAMGLVATIAIFTFVPAVGAFVTCDLTPAQYAALPLDVYTPARTLDALRSGAMTTLRLNEMEGLVAFPSFHTEAAIFYMWALWPVKAIRWPVAALNTAMILTTPIGGAHYLIDVVAGAVMALAAIVASGWLYRVKIGTSATAPAMLWQSAARSPRHGLQRVLAPFRAWERARRPLRWALNRLAPRQLPSERR
jgi:membrane-associated phospholipid phosphatase